MNYLGLDYGGTRIGLAKASSYLRVATPLKTIDNSEQVFDDIKKIVESEQIESIVIGVPVSLDGNEYKFAKKIRGFGNKIEKQTGVRVNFVDEVLTSDKASQHQAKDLDASSAAIILQDFLDQQREG